MLLLLYALLAAWHTTIKWYGKCHLFDFLMFCCFYVYGQPYWQQVWSGEYTKACRKIAKQEKDLITFGWEPKLIKPSWNNRARRYHCLQLGQSETDPARSLEGIPWCRMWWPCLEDSIQKSRVLQAAHRLTGLLWGQKDKKLCKPPMAYAFARERQGLNP